MFRNDACVNITDEMNSAERMPSGGTSGQNADMASVFTVPFNANRASIGNNAVKYCGIKANTRILHQNR